MADGKRHALFESLERLLPERRWDLLRSTWVATIPLLSPPGVSPVRTVAQFLVEADELESMDISREEITTFTYARGEIPELVFREAVFWLHKAVHVLGAAEKHAEVGQPTWCLTQAYQSGYFAARSIMAFLGVAIAELERISVVVDLCRDLRGKRPQAAERLGAFEENVPFYSIGVLFTQNQVWGLFQRVLRGLTREPWTTGLVDYFANVGIGSLNRQRHSLHYLVDYWVYDDLHQWDFPNGIAEVDPTGTGRTLFDINKNNISLCFAYTFVSMAKQLLISVGEVSNRVAEEQALLATSLWSERHPLFGERLSAIQA